MELKQVVVTGLSALTPIGNTLDEYWTALQEGKSGAATITQFVWHCLKHNLLWR